MRILAIRGENLASLYGAFQLPLDEAPIAGVGLFSIAGPTGAGKSTLLDALCLALYGKTPRLRDDAGRKKVLVGWADEEERLEMNDARALVSRGAASAFAQVDYEGVDGKRYRSTWRVHRARKRADGALQPQSMTVEELDRGEVLAERVSEVVPANERRVGFTFDEFKRAVVLPQFEFTNFLRAGADVRASILERVTGTDVYSRLSLAAHACMTRETAARDELAREAEGVLVLADADRTALEARRVELEARQVLAREAARRAGADVAWHVQAAKLAQDLAAAEAARASAAAALEAAAPRRAELEAVEAAEPHRGALEAIERTERARVEAERRAAAAAEALPRAQVAREEASRRASAAQANLVAAERAEEGARPELAEARRLDQAVAEARRVEAAGGEALARARSEERTAATALAEAERARARAECDRARAEAWLAENAAVRPLASEWNRWEARLREHAAACADLGRAESALGQARAEAGAAARTLAAAEEETRRAADAEGGARADAEHAAAEANAQDRPALDRELRRLSDRRAALLELWRAADEAAKARGRREAARAEAEGAAAEIAAVRVELQARLTDVAAADATAAAERSALRRIEQRLDLADRRADLVEGEPCPLCGSTEHPYAHGAPPSLVAEQQQAVRAAEAAASAAARRREEAATRLAAADARERAARRTEAAAEAQRAEHAGAFEAARARLGDEAVPGAAEDAADAVKALGVETKAALDTAHAAQQAAAANAEAAERARRALDGARNALEAARETRARAERTAAEKAELVRRLEDDAARLGRDRARFEDELAPALAFLAGWRERARAEGAALRTACAARFTEHAGQEAARDAAARSAAEQGAQVESARARAAERSARTAQAEAAVAEAIARRSGAEAERARVLAGRDADGLEAALRGATAAARAALEEARGAQEQASRDLALAEQEARGAGEALAGARAEEATSAAALQAALTALGIDRSGLAARLGRGRAWVREERSGLEALHVAAERAAAARAERERLVAEHAAARPEGELEDARGREAEARAEEARHAEELSQVRLDLQRDAENRERHTALGTELARRRAIAERWERLAKVIGSADGKKFRVFAQGLALDALLEAANVHLRELARRYRLMRVPGADLEIQVVDQDLGNEVRTVNGLSGGELFLVSLALALGLASLSTRAVHARTLFIDEGFGTLDRDTLEHAMAALDGLRASGRTIGVISHVPELHERIGVQVTVERVSAGRSRVVLPAG